MEKLTSKQSLTKEQKARASRVVKPTTGARSAGARSTSGAKTAAGVKRKPQAKKKPVSPEVKHRRLVVFMLLIAAISLYVLVASCFYMLSWSADQSVIQEALNSNTAANASLLANETGPLGARIGNVLIGEWFGVFGVILPICVLIMFFFVTQHRKDLIMKLLLVSVSGVVVLSTATTFFTPFFAGVFGTSLGGGFGLVASSFISSYIGSFGTFMLIVLSVLFWTLYTFPNSLAFYGKVYRSVLMALVAIFARKKKEAKAVDNEPDEQGSDEACDEQEEEDPIDMFLSSTDDLLASSNPFEGGVELVSPATRPATSPASESVNSNANSDEVPFTFSIAKDEDEEEDYTSTHRDDMREDTFEIVVSSEAKLQTAEGSNSTIIEVDTGRLSPEEIQQEPFDPRLELSRYKMPPLDLLEDRQSTATITEEEIRENKERITTTLRNFAIEIQSIKATVGPTVTLYEIVPAIGIRINKIKNLEDDIALSLSAPGIRIIAPMPGKGTIGIEVPNLNKEVVSMYSVVGSKAFQSSQAELPIVLGRTIQNKNFVIDLAKMPHMLVAGATGQGKSVGLNAIIASLLYKKHPSELKFVMVDPKKVELSLYSSLENHYLAKMEEEDEAIITDTQRVINTLNSLCVEMDERYGLLKAARMKNIKEYNDKFRSRVLNPNKGHKFMPYIVVIIDEFADLITTAGKEIETPISRIAQLARAVGIHLVIATQRPAVNVITGLIKANFPARIAFRVMTSVDSKIILDTPGANQLIGRGDMLVSVGGEVTRLQCAFIDTPEIERIAEFVGDQPGFGSAMILPEYVPEKPERDSDEGGRTLSRRDGLFDEIARYVVVNQQGSASTIQRNFSIGFNRAGRIMDQLEKAGIVGKQQGSKPRDVRIADLSSLEILLYDLDNGGSYDR